MSSFLKLLFRNRLAAMGAVVIGAILLLALVTPVLPLADPDVTATGDRFMKPFSAGHLLGTDHLGRDLLSRLLWGTRLSLAVGIAAAIIAGTIGSAIGIIAGYFGGRIDNVIMRVTDVIMCIPDLIIIMALVSVLGPGLLNIVIAIGVLGWTGKTRLLRAQILAVREKEYVTAARCSGASDRRIMLRHILPNSFSPLLVAGTLSVAGAILTEASLSFLGFGILPPSPSWGEMLNAARSFTRLQENPWIWMPPGIMILLTVLAINFIGDGLRDSLDPRQKER